MNWPRSPSPKKLVDLAQAYYGTRDTDWYDRLARDTGVHRTTVWRWATGRTEIPPIVVKWLEGQL